MADPTSLRALISSDAPLTWVITGDSITQGMTHTNGSRAYPDHLHEIIRRDLARSRDALINTAISGHRLSDILEDFDHRVAQWRPTVVTLMIGTNDCAELPDRPAVSAGAFELQVHEFLDRVRALEAIPVLQTPPPVDAANAPNRRRIGEFVGAIRTAAEGSGTILVDHFARFTALFTALAKATGPWALMDDPFHPGALGHAAIAAELTEVLGVAGTGVTLRRLRAEVAARF